MFSIPKKTVECEECYQRFTTDQYDNDCICMSCRSTKALERIANALEYWVGMQ